MIYTITVTSYYGSHLSAGNKYRKLTTIYYYSSCSLALYTGTCMYVIIRSTTTRGTVEHVRGHY
jgi:hypothetical protein